MQKVCADAQLPRLFRVDLIGFDVHMCRGEGEEKKMVRRDQRQTLYCHITGPCCILNSTNLSKQSDKILRWRDALPPRRRRRRHPPALTSYLVLPLLQSKYSSANKWCRSHGSGLKTHIHKKVKKKKKKTTSTTTWQGLDRCQRAGEGGDQICRRRALFARHRCF